MQYFKDIGNIKMDLDILVNLCIILKLDLDNFIGEVMIFLKKNYLKNDYYLKMDNYTKVNFLKIIMMEMENFLKKMVRFIKVNGKEQITMG